jgi:hypothetical protein
MNGSTVAPGAMVRAAASIAWNSSVDTGDGGGACTGGCSSAKVTCGSPSISLIIRTSSAASSPGTMRMLKVARPSLGMTLARKPPFSRVSEVPARSTALCSGSRESTAAARPICSREAPAAVSSSMARFISASSSIAARR